MKNIIYRSNIWFDRHESLKLLFVIIIISSNWILSLFFSIIVSYLIWALLLFLFFTFRFLYITDVIKFDRSKYKMPIVGETVVTKKDFYYDGSFIKFINHSDPSRKPNYMSIKKGTEMSIYNIKQVNGDWLLTFLHEVEATIFVKIEMYYFETKNYWISKSDIRENKLKKLGILN